jgi:hypothetical protein
MSGVLLLLVLCAISHLVSGRFLSTAHVFGEEKRFTACLAHQCKGLVSDSLDGVTVVYVDDLTTGAARLQDRDETLRAPSKTQPDQIIAIILDTSLANGGYPEDLADSAQALGYDLVIQQEYGDDSWNCGFGATFTRRRTCPIPIWRVSLDYMPVLQNATTVDLVRDSNPTQQGDIAGSIIWFVGCLVFLAIPTTFVAILRLVQLGAPFNLNIGIAVCYLALSSVITVVMVNANIMSMAINGFEFMGYPSFAMLLAVGGALSLLSIHIIAFRVHLVTKEAIGISTVGIWKEKWAIVLNIVILYLLIGLIIASHYLGMQTRANGSVSWYVLMNVQYLIARLVFAIYFIIVHRKLAKLLHVAEVHKATDVKTSATVRIYKKLVPLAILMFVALFCTICMAVSSVFYKAGGYFFISGLVTSTLILHFLQVLTITDSRKSSEKNQTQLMLSHVAKFINDTVDKIFVCFNGDSIAGSKVSDGHKRNESLHQAASVPVSAANKSHHSRGPSEAPAVLEAQEIATKPQAVVSTV